MSGTVRILAAGACTGVLLLAGCTAGASPDGDGAPTEAPTGAPALTVGVVADGLDHPWDVALAPDGTLLLDERSGGLTAVLPDGSARRGAGGCGDLLPAGA